MNRPVSIMHVLSRKVGPVRSLFEHNVILHNTLDSDLARDKEITVMFTSSQGCSFGKRSVQSTVLCAKIIACFFIP